MNDELNKTDQRWSNARLAWSIVGGMALLAAIAVVFTLLTKDWRRGGDTLKQEMPSFGQSIAISLAIFAIVACIIGFLVGRFNRPR